MTTTKRIIKDDIVNSIQKFWLTEIEVKKTVSAKRIFRFSVIKVMGIKDDYFIIKYSAMGVLPRILKIRYNDIINMKSSFKRKKYITGVDIMKITQLKKSDERRVLKNKTFAIKVIIGIIFLGIVVGLSAGLTFIQ